MGDQPALPELADHLDGLLEHLESGFDRRPAMAQDVLVQSLSRTDPEDELPPSRSCEVAAAWARIAG